MSKIILKQTNQSNVPIPPTGRIVIFLDIDNITKVKKDNGNVVPLEGGTGGIVDAENVTYTTNDIIWWNWTSPTPNNVEVALDELARQVGINVKLLDNLLPPPAGDLDAISVVSPINYFGKLPSGLNPIWYSQVSPGTTISVIYDPNIIIESPDFAAGVSGDPSTFGQLTANIDGANVDTYDLTSGIDGVGSNGIIGAFNIGDLNPFWNKARGRITNTGYGEGLTEYFMSHTQSGDSDELDIYYDDNNLLPSFFIPVSVTLSQADEVIKWLSGIQYLTIGTRFLVSYNVDDAFNKVYSVSGVTKISVPGFSGSDVDPQTIPSYNDQFIVSNEPVILDAGNICDINPVLTVIVTKPNNSNAADSNYNIKSNFGKGINTYGIVSTGSLERFQDEARRLVSGTTNSFDSTISLPNGEAQVQCGSVSYGNTDYPTKTGDQFYERFIESGVLNGGILDMGSLIDTDLSQYNTGDLNIFLWLETQNLYFDLGRFFGDNNGTGTGATFADSIGSKVSVNGNEFSFTFGVNSTALNNNRFKIILVFRTNNKIVDKIELI